MPVYPPALPDPHQPHALAFATLVIHDALVADLVDLQFDSGLWRRARVTSPLRHRDRPLAGRHLAALYLRTDPTGRLDEPPFLAALYPEPAAVVNRWSATGTVFSLDRTAGLVRVRVRPGAGVRPIPLTARATPAQLRALHPQQTVHLTGTLQAGALVADTVELQVMDVEATAWSLAGGYCEARR